MSTERFSQVCVREKDKNRLGRVKCSGSQGHVGVLVTVVRLSKFRNWDDKWRTLLHGSHAFTCPSEIEFGFGYVPGVIPCWFWDYFCSSVCGHTNQSCSVLEGGWRGGWKTTVSKCYWTGQSRNWRNIWKLHRHAGTGNCFSWQICSSHYVFDDFPAVLAYVSVETKKRQI